jgi:hypothetical protein
MPPCVGRDRSLLKHSSAILGTRRPPTEPISGEVVLMRCLRPQLLRSD